MQTKLRIQMLSSCAKWTSAAAATAATSCVVAATTVQQQPPPKDGRRMRALAKQSTETKITQRQWRTSQSLKFTPVKNFLFILEFNSSSSSSFLAGWLAALQLPQVKSKSSSNRLNCKPTENKTEKERERERNGFKESNLQCYNVCVH